MKEGMTEKHITMIYQENQKLLSTVADNVSFLVSGRLERLQML